MAIVQRMVGGKSRWDARVRGPGGEQISRTFDLKRDAQRFEREHNQQIATGTWRDPRDGKRPFGEVADSWLRSNPGKAALTLKRDGTNLRVHIRPAIGKRQIGSLRSSDVQAFVNGLAAKGLAPSTVARSHSCTRSGCWRAVASSSDRWTVKIARCATCWPRSVVARGRPPL